MGLSVLDKVTISYRGASYEIGGGRSFFAVWALGAPRSEPLERWPSTKEGWSAAWARFTSIEAPGTIGPVARGTVLRDRMGSAGRALSGVSSGTASRLSGGLLALGVILGIAGLFPSYLNGSSLAQEPASLVPHVMYLAAWTASAVLALFGGARLRAGALLGLGVTAVTFGLFFADAGSVIAAGAHVMGAGLVLALLGWIACAAGSALAFRHRAGGSLARPRGEQLGPVALLILVGLGVAVAFAPAWDSYLLRASGGFSETVTAGNAFANPGAVIAGEVITMIAIVVIVAVAGLWRPPRQGALLLTGAIIPVAAQAISALVQDGEATSPVLFGISPARASAAGLTITNGLTPVFWIYCVFVVALIVSCAWLLLTPAQPAFRPPAQPIPARVPPVVPAGAPEQPADHAPDDRHEDSPA
jgi:hypothetical protein